MILYSSINVKENNMNKLLIALLIFIAAALLLSAYMIFIEPSMIVYEKLDRKVPESVKECKIVFFSDTHMKGRRSIKQLERAIESINEQSPDIVIFGGDFFDNYYRDKSHLDLRQISASLKKISAKYAKLAVYGNHDHGGGAAGAYEEVMAEAGFQLLLNDTVYIAELGLNVTGTDDLQLGYITDDMYEPFTDDFNLIVTHSPDFADEITAKNALVLAGHSHGGQVNLPFITKKIMPPGARKYRRGLYTNELNKGNDFWLFVSKGIGTTALPIRLFAPPDIAVIELKN